MSTGRSHGFDPKGLGKLQQRPGLGILVLRCPWRGQGRPLRRKLALLAPASGFLEWVEFLLAPFFLVPFFVLVGGWCRLELCQFCKLWQEKC